MLLARHLNPKKPPRFFTRHYNVIKIDPPLVTFRPESLVALRPPPLDLSNRITRSVWGIPLTYCSQRHFPAGSKGFLYYQPGSTELSGQLRLRICDDASSFDDGRDLLVNDIQPWALHLINLMRNPRCTPLVATVVKDGFVSPQTIANMRPLLADTGFYPWMHPLCALSDPFYVHLDHQVMQLNVLTENHHARYNLRHMFSTINVGKRTGNPLPSISPFTGVVKVRLELSKLPEHASLGPTLILKVLDACNVRHVRKDITIIKKPIAGEYHYRFPHGQMTMWRLCIDEVVGGRAAFGPLLDMPGVVYAE